MVAMQTDAVYSQDGSGSENSGSDTKELKRELVAKTEQVRPTVSPT